ncbi:hypothetical protein [Pacificibacter marinus]|uniref:Uncharacterized protein n=1 Tax=Pacificibacter marinus TaxID=658057 RepID=A0A1Y5T8F5_9RHOB|nr:hypothetical protein [Pacificibacter marinus]SEL00190.1 hypothetical protein SAMN04488032_109136 [Pacificibacter marinus]SLN54705.1 hypothetical protein PAM7971_02827 [Pacificibacter marinus]
MTKDTTIITVNSVRCIDKFFYTMDVSIEAHGVTEGIQIIFEYFGANVGLHIDRVNGKHGLIEAHHLFHAHEDELTEKLHDFCFELEVAWAS